MKLAIVGSRGIPRDIIPVVEDAIAGILIFFQTLITHVVTGGAVGVDTIAAARARARNIPVIEIKPDYTGFAPGHAAQAPLRRNSIIVNQCDFFIAFRYLASNGTTDAIKKALDAGKQGLVYTVTDTDLTCESLHFVGRSPNLDMADKLTRLSDAPFIKFVAAAWFRDMRSERDLNLAIALIIEECGEIAKVIKKRLRGDRSPMTSKAALTKAFAGFWFALHTMRVQWNLPDYNDLDRWRGEISKSLNQNAVYLIARITEHVGALACIYSTHVYEDNEPELDRSAITRHTILIQYYFLGLIRIFAFDTSDIELASRTRHIALIKSSGAPKGAAV